MGGLDKMVQRRESLRMLWRITKEKRTVNSEREAQRKRRWIEIHFKVKKKNGKNVSGVLSSQNCMSWVCSLKIWEGIDLVLEF